MKGCIYQYDTPSDEKDITRRNDGKVQQEFTKIVKFGDLLRNMPKKFKNPPLQ